MLLDEGVDPGVVVLTCANCGAAMDERKCKLICRCGYFLSCSDDSWLRAVIGRAFAGAAVDALR